MRDYVKPMMFMEQFTVDESVAVGCSPYVDESTVTKQLIQCYYFENNIPGERCSNRNTDQYFFIDGTNQGCTVRLKEDGSVTTSAGLNDEMWCFTHHQSTGRDTNHGLTEYGWTCNLGEPAYSWDNGSRGSHHIRAVEFGGQDSQGRPLYFNS